MNFSFQSVNKFASTATRYTLSFTLILLACVLLYGSLLDVALAPMLVLCALIITFMVYFVNKYWDSVFGWLWKD